MFDVERTKTYTDINVGGVFKHGLKKLFCAGKLR